MSEGGAAGVDRSTQPDCYFEASLASMASSPQGQKDISKMITQTPDGSYKVTFPGAPDRPVTIGQNDLATAEDQFQVSNSATWANVLETAFLKFNKQNGITETDAHYAQNLLTGHLSTEITVSDQDRLNEARDDQKGRPSQLPETTPDLGQVLQAELANGEMITALAAGPASAAADGMLHTQHDYSVMKYENGMITIRNPWGNQPGGTESGQSEQTPAVGQTKDSIRLYRHLVLIRLEWRQVGD